MSAVLRPNPPIPSDAELALLESDAIAAAWGGDVIALANADPNEVDAVGRRAIWRHGCDAGMIAPPTNVATPSDPHSAEALDLDAIQKRADAATARPWTAWNVLGYEDDEQTIIMGDGVGPAVIQSRVAAMLPDHEGYDADFIAHARTDVPALVATVRARDAEVAELKAKLIELSHGHAETYADGYAAAVAELNGGPHIEGCWYNCGKFPCSCVCHQTGVNGKSARSASSPVEAHDSTCDGLEGCPNPAAHSVEGGN